jgi:hypothetical protein
MVFTMFFFASGSKNHGIYFVFRPVPSTMLRDVVSICEKDKNTVFYDVCASRAQPNLVKKWLKNGQKSTSKSILIN